MCKRTIASEYVSFGHPDKIADQISDAILDEFLKVDKNVRTGIEVMVKDNIVVLGGEINSKATVDYDKIVRNVYSNLSFPTNHNLSPDNIKIINLIGKQSSEIHNGVDKSETEIGAGDQGFCVGFASNETEVFIPLGHYIAKKICNYVAKMSECGPDTKSQVIVDYDDETNETKVVSILVSTMHQNNLEDLRSQIKQIIVNNKMQMSDYIFEKYLKDKDIKIDINPCGEWRIGGPVSDCGVTGRKIVVDQFGGYCNVGGGAFSGKESTKVDRSAAYMARYIAKNIVASGLANTAKVELSYMIGVCEPCGLNIELDTNCEFVERIKTWLYKNVDMTPYGIITRFNGSYPRYYNTAKMGHYGYIVDGDDLLETLFPWEKLDLVKKIEKDLLSN